VPVALGERAWSAGLGLGGCLGDGDVEAEGLELAEAGADLAVAVGCALVPVGAEAGEPGVGAGRQVPDDDEDRAGDGALGPVPAQALRQAAESFAEEGFGAGGAVGGLGAVALEAGVALPLSSACGCGARTGGQPGRARPGKPGGRRSGTGSCPGRSRR
jgi:hypothetical protein